MSCVFQNIDPPPPSPPGECVPPAFGAGGGHTRWVERGGGQGVLRNQFRFETTETSSGTIRNKTFVSVFRFYTETESFDVSIELKQTEDQPKQFDREHNWLFFTENLGFFQFFRFFFVFSGFFRFVSVVSLLYRNREFRCFNRTETNRRPNQTV